MYLKTTFDDKFNDIFMHLRGKYGDDFLSIEGIGKEQLDMAAFSRKFFRNKGATADVSIDANANIDDKTMIVWGNELTKPYHRFNSFYLLWNELQKENSLVEANTILEHIISGDVYVHDSWNIQLPYCFNYSCQDILYAGLPMVTKIKSGPPKHLYSFKSQLEQVIAILSNSTLGACGIADVFICMSYFVKKILDTRSDAGFAFASEVDCWKYVEENIVSLVYTLNQPFRGGSQSPFTNVSVYDSYFLDKFCGDYVFPDGTHPDKQIVQKLQDIYLGIMNEELSRTSVTFPVTTACFSIDEQHNVMDMDFLDFIVKHNMKYAFINIYAGKTSTLSSCCFCGDEVIELYRDNEGRRTKLAIPMNEFVNSFNDEQEQGFEQKLDREYKIKSFNFEKGFEEESYVVGVLKKRNEFGYLVRVCTHRNSIFVTPDHEFNLVRKGSGENCVVAAKDIDPKVYRIPEQGDMNTELVDIICVYNSPHVGWVYDIELEKNHYFPANNIISHNCRLRSSTEKLYLNLIGGSSTRIGSVGVCTINLPRLAYLYKEDAEEKFFDRLKYFTQITGKINNAKRSLIKKRINNGFLPAYTQGFMDIKSQYSTTGFTGLYEATDLFGKNILTDEGLEFTKRILGVMNEEIDSMDALYKYSHNLEQVPAETVAIKLARKDKALGMNIGDIYSNQFVPLVSTCNLLDRVRIQGELDKFCSGGSILHMNLGEVLESEETHKNLILSCIKRGVIYHAVNYIYNICEQGHVSVGKYEKCVQCSSSIKSYTRVVGFLTSISAWAEERREQDFPNRKFYTNGSLKLAVQS